MKPAFLFISAFLIIAMACKDTITYPCEEIREGLLNINTAIAQDGINEILVDLTPLPTDDDPIGHEANLNIFVERLSESCDIEATIGCYACIETFPLLSHVEITIDSGSVQVHRSIDIVTPEGSVMSLRNIHP